MTDIETVRLLIGDRKKAAVREEIGIGDGATTEYQLDMYPIASAPTAVLAIFLTGTTAATNSYTISGGLGKITFNAAPTDGHTILASYSYYALTSGELSDILSGLTGQPYLAAANACLILAADASRYYAYTLGDKSVDKRQISKNLRDQADDLLERHNEMMSTQNYTATVITFKDNTGTPYYDYDTAVAYVTSTS